ncbi:MAG: hypothetical protein L6R36_007002, partial [Xanthoria steineri]
LFVPKHVPVLEGPVLDSEAIELSSEGVDLGTHRSVQGIYHLAAEGEEKHMKNANTQIVPSSYKVDVTKVDGNIGPLEAFQSSIHPPLMSKVGDKNVDSALADENVAVRLQDQFEKHPSGPIDPEICNVPVKRGRQLLVD